MILVDSSVWIDYFRGTENPQSNHLDALLGSQPIAIGDLMLTEILQGFSRERDFIQASEVLAELEQIDIAGREIALEAARHFRTLRLKGVTVRKTIDTMIATRCVHDSLPLLYSDRDFDPFVEHLGLINAMTWQD